MERGRKEEGREGEKRREREEKENENRNIYRLFHLSNLSLVDSHMILSLPHRTHNLGISGHTLTNGATQPGLIIRFLLLFVTFTCNRCLLKRRNSLVGKYGEDQFVFTFGSQVLNAFSDL